MVGKSMRGTRDAQRFQMLKKALWMPDTGDSMDIHFIKIGGSSLARRVEQVVKNIAVEAHRIKTFSGIAAVHDYRIHSLQA